MGKLIDLGLRDLDKKPDNSWTVSIGGLSGREYGNYDPKDPDKFKRLAEHYRSLSDAETEPEPVPTQAEMEETYPAAHSQAELDALEAYDYHRPPKGRVIVKD